MSKPVKNMIVKEYRHRFSGVEGAVLVEIRGLDAPATNKMRNDFARKSVKVAVVKNTLAREAFKGGALEQLGAHLSGPTALVYSQDSVIDLARDLVKWAKGVEKFVFKAAILEGVVYEGPVEHETMGSYLAAADAICAPYPSAAPGYFSPLKVVELANGR